jgi:hypothetical protein
VPVRLRLVSERRPYAALGISTGDKLMLGTPAVATVQDL